MLNSSGSCNATHYRPKDDRNFLRDWNNGIYPAGWDNKPVTWVSLEDAEPMPPGAASACPMNGNGNTRLRAQTVAYIRGAMNGMRRLFPWPIPAAACEVQMT